MVLWQRGARGGIRWCSERSVEAKAGSDAQYVSGGPPDLPARRSSCPSRYPAGASAHAR